MKTVEFFFDPISPYSWLAWTRFEGLKMRTGVKLRFTPVLFAALLEANGQKGPAEIESKRAYTFLDAHRWAGKYGKKLEGPPAHPFNPLLPLRLCAAVEDDAKREILSGEILDAAWGRGLDITKEDVLADLLQKTGLDAAAYLARAKESETKERLKRMTAAALAKGVFGVPSFLVDGELFWGNDRLSILEDHLRGRLPVDKAHVAVALARPRAADRKR